MDKPIGNKLTPKQLHFARCVASGISQAAAYREAYNTKSPKPTKTQHEAASRLMSNAKIRARVDALVAAKERGMIASALSDKQRVLNKLRAMMDSAEPGDSVKLRATELLGRSVGLFKDVVETHETRSPEEIAAEIEERLAALSQTGDDDAEDMVPAEVRSSAVH